MPVQTVRNSKGEIIGYRWGNNGKIYKTKGEAERQGRAIKAAQATRSDKREIKVFKVVME